MKHDSPRALLNRIMVIIQKDVEHIENDISLGKLEHESASDIVKYSGALLAMIKDDDAQKDAQKRKLTSLETQELVSLGQKAIENLKAK